MKKNYSTGKNEKPEQHGALECATQNGSSSIRNVRCILECENLQKDQKKLSSMFLNFFFILLYNTL